MPFTMNWHHEKRIIIGHCRGTMTIEDVVGWNKEVSQYLDKGLAPIHLIINVSELKKFPTNILQLKNNLGYLRHPAKGWTLLVGSSSFVNTLARIVTQLSGREFRTFRMMSSAVDFLIKEDATLGNVALNDPPKT